MVYHPPLIFNNSTVTQITSQKHLSVILDSRLTFNDRLNIDLSKVSDMIRTYSQIHHTDKYLQLGSIIWPVCLNG